MIKMYTTKITTTIITIFLSLFLIPKTTFAQTPTPFRYCNPDPTVYQEGYCLEGYNSGIYEFCYPPAVEVLDPNCIGMRDPLEDPICCVEEHNLTYYDCYINGGVCCDWANCSNTYDDVLHACSATHPNSVCCAPDSCSTFQNEYTCNWDSTKSPSCYVNAENCLGGYSIGDLCEQETTMLGCFSVHGPNECKAPELTVTTTTPPPYPFNLMSDLVLNCDAQTIQYDGSYLNPNDIYYICLECADGDPDNGGCSAGTVYDTIGLGSPGTDFSIQRSYNPLDQCSFGQSLPKGSYTPWLSTGPNCLNADHVSDADRLVIAPVLCDLTSEFPPESYADNRELWTFNATNVIPYNDYVAGISNDPSCQIVTSPIIGFGETLTFNVVCSNISKSRQIMLQSMDMNREPSLCGAVFGGDNCYGETTLAPGACFPSCTAPTMPDGQSTCPSGESCCVWGTVTETCSMTVMGQYLEGTCHLLACPGFFDELVNLSLQFPYNPDTGYLFAGINPLQPVCTNKPLQACCIQISPDEYSAITRPPILPQGDCALGEIETAIGCIRVGPSAFNFILPSLVSTAFAAGVSTPSISVTEFTQKWLTFAIGIGGGTAMLLIIIAGFQMITSAGNPQRARSAKQLLTSALSGLAMIIFSVYLLEVIGLRIFHLPGL